MEVGGKIWKKNEWAQICYNRNCEEDGFGEEWSIPSKNEGFEL